MPPPFASVDQARPFLQKALAWRIQDSHAENTLWLINSIRLRHLVDLAYTSLPYLERTRSNVEMPIRLRGMAIMHAGKIYMDSNKFEDAANLFEQLLVFHSEEPEILGISEATEIHFVLGMALHYTNTFAKKFGS